MAEGIALILGGVLLAVGLGKVAYDNSLYRRYDWKLDTWIACDHKDWLREAIIVAVVAGIGPVLGGVFLIATS